MWKLFAIVAPFTVVALCFVREPYEYLVAVMAYSAGGWAMELFNLEKKEEKHNDQSN